MFPIGIGEPRMAMGAYWARTGEINPNSVVLLSSLARTPPAPLSTGWMWPTGRRSERKSPDRKSAPIGPQVGLKLQPGPLDWRQKQPIRSQNVFDQGLTPEDVQSLKRVAFAVDRFEPFPGCMIAPATLSRLTEVGMIESGPSCRPAVAPTGYRLTDSGWRVARERWADMAVDLVA